MAKGTSRSGGTPSDSSGRFEGVLTSITMADYDRDGFLDLYLCVYSYFFGAGEDKAGTPAPYYDARNGPPGVLFRNDGRGRFVDVTREVGLDVGNNRYHFAAAWADYDNDGWPDLLVANDFGTKNLYHNLGRRDGKVKFEDVAAAAGVLDHGAGMSAAFLDYDNDGLLDIYTGNMWSAPGLRDHVGADVHARCDAGSARALSATCSREFAVAKSWQWTLRGQDARGARRDGSLGVVVGRTRFRQRRPGRSLHRQRHADTESGRGQKSGGDLEGFFWRQVVARSPLTRVPGTPYDDAWRAINQLLVHGSIASRQRNVFLRNDGHGGYDEISGALGLDLDQDGRSFAVLDIDGDGDPDLVVMADRQAPQVRIFRNDFETTSASLAVRLRGTKSNRDAIGARVTVETDRLRKTSIVQAGSGFLSQHSKELLIGLGASERVLKLTVNWPSGETQVFTDVPLNTRIRIVEGGDMADGGPQAAIDRAHDVGSSRFGLAATGHVDVRTVSGA